MSYLIIVALLASVPSQRRADDIQALLRAVCASEDDEQILSLLAELEQAARRAGQDELADEAARLRRAVGVFVETLRGRPVGWRARQQMRETLDAFGPSSALFPVAAFYAARTHFWIGREGGSRDEYARAEKLFRARAKLVKPGPLVRMYLGERIPWSTGRVQPPQCDAPQWCLLQYELLQRTLAVIHYWVEERQQPDGQFGGGWGDDCEMLRNWPIAVLAADDLVVRRGMRLLVDGLWHAENLEQYGFPTRMSDVEHVAEDVSDTQPAMLAYDYGNPTYIVRCTKPAKLMRDLWTAVNPRGQRLFRSAWFSATQVRAEKPYAADVFYAARAAKPAIWLGWYGRYPAIARLLCEWMDSWVAAAASTDRGKPKGVLPPAIGFEDGRIGGYGPTWWDPDLKWSYYVWPGAMRLMHEALLAAYAMSGNPKYLRPIETEAQLVVRYEGKPSGPPGSPQWCAAALRGIIAPALAKRRLLTGDTKFDSILMRHGTAYTKFLISRNVRHLLSALEGSLQAMRYNWPMLTTEVRFTDRVWIRGHDLLFSMFTGADGISHYYPVFAVTWLRTRGRVAALVTDATDDSLSLLAYNFRDRRLRVGLRLWRLKWPRTYRWRLAAANHRGQAVSAVANGTVRIAERGDVLWLVLPPRKLVRLDIDAAGPAPRQPGRLADVALSDDCVSLRRADGGTIIVTAKLYNLGPAAAENVVVSVVARGRQEPLAVRHLGRLAPMDGFDPTCREVTLRVRAADAARGLRAVCQTSSPEITTNNNSTSWLQP